jgi:hypothetical protein
MAPLNTLVAKGSIATPSKKNVANLIAIHSVKATIDPAIDCYRPIKSYGQGAIGPAVRRYPPVKSCGRDRHCQAGKLLARNGVQPLAGCIYY